MEQYLLSEPNNGLMNSTGKLKKNGDHSQLMIKLLDTLKQEKVDSLLQLFMEQVIWHHNGKDPKHITQSSTGLRETNFEEIVLI